MVFLTTCLVAVGHRIKLSPVFAYGVGLPLYCICITRHTYCRLCRSEKAESLEEATEWETSSESVATDGGEMTSGGPATKLRSGLQLKEIVKCILNPPEVPTSSKPVVDFEQSESTYYINNHIVSLGSIRADNGGVWEKGG